MELFLGGIESALAEVLLDGAAEDRGVLRHQRDGLPEAV
jgi:hypothetical protein